MAIRRCIFNSLYGIYGGTKSYDEVSVSSYDATGGSATVVVGSNKKWTIISQPAWVSTNLNSGGCGRVNLTITAAASQESADRNGSLILRTKSGCKKTLEIKVSQQAAPAPTNVTVSANTSGLVSFTNTSTFNLSNIQISLFSIFDGIGGSMSANPQNIADIPMEGHVSDVAMSWSAGTNSFESEVGQTITARMAIRLSKAGEGGGNLELSPYITGNNFNVNGVYNQSLSTNDTYVFDFNLGQLTSPGVKYLGNIGIYVDAAGGDAYIHVSSITQYLSNEGGIVKFDVTWGHLDNAGIYFYVVGDSEVSILSGPSPSHIAETTGTRSGSTGISVTVGPNTGASGSFYLYGSGYTKISTIIIDSGRCDQSGGYIPKVNLTLDEPEGGSVVWRTYPSDEFIVEISFTNCTAITVNQWESELKINSFTGLTGGTISGGGFGHQDVRPIDTIIPNSTDGTIRLSADVSYQKQHATTESMSGTIVFTGYDNQGRTSVVSVHCDS